jgi:hypothetical protein
MPEKHSGDGQGYHPDLAGAKGSGFFGHNRQYSNATTAAQDGKTPSPTGAAADDKGSGGGHAAPAGHPGARSLSTGPETTYQEWCQRVGGQGPPLPQNPPPGAPEGPENPKKKKNQNNGHGQQPQPQPQPQEPFQAVPYVTYPNDPYSHYTLNGSNRMFPRPQMPPPGYYRPY